MKFTVDKVIAALDQAKVLIGVGTWTVLTFLQSWIESQEDEETDE